MKPWMSLCAAGALALGLTVSVLLAATGQGQPLRTVNWDSHNNMGEQAYSPLDQINTADVGRLGLAWFRDLPDERMLEATPLAVDGVLYFSGSYSKVYAVDAVSGALKWTYDPQVWKHDPHKLRFMIPVNRGVAFADGRVFVATLDGRLIALDAKTGKTIWIVATTAHQSVQTITAAPRTFHDKVIIGNGGSDFGARGYVSAYDQRTGKLVWRFYMAPGSPEENKGQPAMERAAATWRGQYWKTGTGGGPWDNITFDPELNRVYVGAGNAAPYDPEQRSPGGGDNLYTASIVALNADTGQYVWHYQINPRDSWDFDTTQQMALANLTIDGKPRKVLMQAPKNGFFYVLDRTDGKLISAEPIGKVTWATRIDVATGRPVEVPDVRYQNGPIDIWPAPMGAHSWQTMSYSPKAGLVFIPYMQLGMRYEKTTDPASKALGGVSMTFVKSDPRDGTGALIAWDPVAQKQRWNIPRDHIWNGGTLATAGGLVFEGITDGTLNAYDATSGQRLWHFDAGQGIIAAPMSYAVNGRQYVAVLVGYGGSNMLGNVMNVGWKYGAQPRRVLVFALDGKVVPPPQAPRDMSVKAVDVPSLRLDPRQVGAGALLFNTRCGTCHGLNAVSGGAPAPDLRESQLATNRENFGQVLHGALLPGGMPRFDDLNTTQVADIYAYIRSEARRALVQAKTK